MSRQTPGPVSVTTGIQCGFTGSPSLSTPVGSLRRPGFPRSDSHLVPPEGAPTPVPRPTRSRSVGTVTRPPPSSCSDDLTSTVVLS